MRLITASLILLSVASSSFHARPSTASAPQVPTFRGSANYVEVDVVVRDRQGDFVRGLPRDAFQVLEDGTPQDIAAFSVVDLPVAAGTAPARTAAPRVEPDVTTNATIPNARVFMIVLDSLNIATERTQFVRQRVHEFVEHFLGPDDVAAITHIGHPDRNQDFTANRTLLLASADAFFGQKAASAALNTLSSTPLPVAGRSGTAANLNADADARVCTGQRALDAVTAIGNYVGALRGRRKTLVLFSEGFSVSPNPARDPCRAQEALRETLASVAQANVNIYTVDPRGMASEGADLLRIGPSATGPDDQLAALNKETKEEQDTLRSLAAETGGLDGVNRNDFAQIFQRIVDDNTSYYVVGYYSSAKTDGKFHPIKVLVAQPNVDVRARKGYYAPTSATALPTTPTNAARATSKELAALLSQPIPSGGPGLELRLAASPVKSNQGKAVVAMVVEVHGAPLNFTEHDGLFWNDVEVGYELLGHDGKLVAGSHDVAHLRLKPDTRQIVRDHGMRYVTEFPVAPGRYQLRVAVHEGVDDRGGSVFSDLDVPAYSKSPLVMAGLVLSSNGASIVPTTGTIPALAGVLTGMPTTARTFAPSDTLFAFARIWDNDAKSRLVHMTTTVQIPGGQDVLKYESDRDSRDFAPDAHGFLVGIQLRHLVAGSYILAITAREPTSGRVAAQQVPFEIADR